MSRQTAACKCGSFDGWRERRVSYYEQHYDEKGDPLYASDGEDRKAGLGGVVKRCMNCNRDIRHLITEEPQ